MRIQRFNSDFGNSTNNFFVNSYYFEIPTNIVEVSKNKAENFLVEKISNPKELLNKLIISTFIDYEEKFYLVGDIAENNNLSNSHVYDMHDKAESSIPYISFLSAVAYYYSVHAPDEDNLVVDIEYMNMMLPIWILKRAPKFKDAQNKMANRFLGEHSLKILTPGMEKEIKINVLNSKCYIESEISRTSLKYKIVNTDEGSVIKKRIESIQFDNANVVLIDIGGGSIDAVELNMGLKVPKSRNSFQVIDIESFLGKLEILRKDKLLLYFRNLRSLEQFIINNYNYHTYIFENLNTGEVEDLTSIITDFLAEYAAVLVTKILNSFQTNSTKTLTFVYFGGESLLLEKFILKALEQHISKEAIERNHYFLDDYLLVEDNEIFSPTPRTLNLNALELKSLELLARDKLKNN